jgi:hypothetical protein
MREMRGWEQSGTRGKEIGEIREPGEMREMRGWEKSGTRGSCL